MSSYKIQNPPVSSTSTGNNSYGTAPVVPSNATMESVLKELMNRSDKIEALAVVTNDGLVKTNLLGDEINPHRFGAMCSSLLSLSKRAAIDASRGDFKLLLIEGTTGTMIVIQIGGKGVLALSAKPKAQLGMIFIEARKTAASLESLI